MYIIELALKLSPFPLSVQRKKLEDAQNLYKHLRGTLEKGKPHLLELSCEKVDEKKITVLTSEIIAIQLYEKTASGGGSKRPGFSFEA